MRMTVILLVVSVTGCGGGTSLCGPGGVESARMQLLATDVEFSRHASEADIVSAFEAVLAPDAVFLPMNYNALYGPADIVTFFSGSEHVRMRWTPADAVVGQECDIGYTFGAWSAQADGDEGERLEFSGKYLGTWKHDVERGWRLAVYMQNADPAVMPVEVPPAGDD